MFATTVHAEDSSENRSRPFDEPDAAALPPHGQRTVGRTMTIRQPNSANPHELRSSRGSADPSEQPMDVAGIRGAEPFPCPRPSDKEGAVREVGVRVVHRRVSPDPSHPNRAIADSVCWKHPGGRSASRICRSARLDRANCGHEMCKGVLTMWQQTDQLTFVVGAGSAPVIPSTPPPSS